MSPMLSALVVLCPSHLGTRHTPLINYRSLCTDFSGDIMDTQAHTHPHTHSEGSILIGQPAESLPSTTSALASAQWEKNHESKKMVSQ